MNQIVATRFCDFEILQGILPDLGLRTKFLETFLGISDLVSISIEAMYGMTALSQRL